MGTKHFSIRLNEDVRALVAELAETWGVTQTQVVERAVNSIGRIPSRDVVSIMAEIQTEHQRLSALMTELEYALQLRDAQPPPDMPPVRKRGRIAGWKLE